MAATPHLHVSHTPIPYAKQNAGPGLAKKGASRAGNIKLDKSQQIRNSYSKFMAGQMAQGVISHRPHHPVFIPPGGAYHLHAGGELESNINTNAVGGGVG